MDEEEVKRSAWLRQVVGQAEGVCVNAGRLNFWIIQGSLSSAIR